MCGVAAIHAYHYAAAPVSREELAVISARLVDRGPDGSGAWYSDNGRVALAHRRLAIIDPDPRAAQPMRSADANSVLSYNGEIYNFRALRNELERSGIRFRTQSDTEVLLSLYEVHGVAMFARLRGMYAFALWDARRGAMLLARDPYGIKPLYLADDGWTVRVASQAKALLASPSVSRMPEPAGQVGFLLFGSVPDPHTMWQQIRAVPAGTLQWIDETGPWAPTRHFSIAAAFAAPPSESGDIERAIQEAVRDSVRAHRVSDVPVGAFLSAGIDSGALLGAMADEDEAPVLATTLTFAEFRGKTDDEAPLAATIAERYRADHMIRTVDEAEFRRDLPRILDAMDQPSIDGINTWFVSKACRERGLKVAVSGVGGDELFGGYASFRDIPRWVRGLALPSRVPFLGAAAQHILAPLLQRQSRISPKGAGMLRYGGTWAGAYLLKRGLFMPWELTGLLAPDVVHEGLRRLDWQELLGETIRPDPGTPYAHVAALESQGYLRNQLLRDADWASMAHGLEVRTPLVDAVLLARLGPLLGCGSPGAGKRALALVPKQPLPASIVDRTKTGFTTPIAAWLDRDCTLDGWRRVPMLTRQPQHWARRLAASLLQQALA